MELQAKSILHSKHLRAPKYQAQAEYQARFRDQMKICYFVNVTKFVELSNRRNKDYSSSTAESKENSFDQKFFSRAKRR